MTSSAASNQTSERGLAVVTGASSGTGLELARQFAQHDVDLLIAAEDEGIEREMHTQEFKPGSARK